MGAAESEPVEFGAPTPLTSLSFTLNGRPVEIAGVSPLLSLNDWLRVQPGLTGTKKMCSEGGCGCCVVAVSTVSLVQVHNEDVLNWEVLDDAGSTIAINSCLCPLYAVNGWNITTVEGIGSSTTGFHALQRRVVEYNGSQCGYCTPGFVMSMYSLLQANPSPAQTEVEDIFDGNICRCTGYRPILDAMKSFSPSSNAEDCCTDIEDLSSKICPKTKKPCSSEHALCWGMKKLESDPSWYAPSSLAELAALCAANPDSSYRLMGGDTGRGVYKDIPKVDMLISLSHVSELQSVQVSDTSLTVGAGVTLTKLIALLETNSSKSPSFSTMARHISKIANTPVRNVATWAGNVMLAYQHQDFPSDIFLLLAATEAVLTTMSLSDSSTSTSSMWDFLSKDMSQSIIAVVEIPFLSATSKFTSYKIMPRAENSKAEANAAFAMEVDPTQNFAVTTKPTLVIGGGDARAVLCPSTASLLEGKSLLDPNTLKGAMASLSTELSSADSTKKGVAQGLLYKFYLSCIPGHVSSEVESASAMLTRPLSGGSQIYQNSNKTPPVGQSINKLEGLVQASGEAQYTTDIAMFPNEISAAFVLATKCNTDIISIDSSAAEQMPGFIRLITASDIPPGGTNNYLSANGMYEPELLFADYRVEFVGQAVALVLADTSRRAQEIAKAVIVNYGESSGPPTIATKDAVDKNALIPGIKITLESGDAQTAISASDVSVKGQIECGSQYHFTMETQNSLVVPHEDGYTVYSSTQWVTNVQLAVANVLGVPNSSVDVLVKKVGGGYGAKIIGSNLPAAACALGACVSRRPVRLQLDLETNMKLIGKRFAYLANYELGVTQDGTVQGIKIEAFGNSGIHPTNDATSYFPINIDNAYSVANWDLTVQLCRTNISSSLACRSPGSLPAIFITESAMDHAAKQLNMDPDDFRRKNLYQQGQTTPTNKTLKYCQIQSLWDHLVQSADVVQRKTDIVTFNKANHWKKRGLSIVPLKFEVDLPNGLAYPVLVNIYGEDGTVAISHGGVEIGQGINTKVAQVAAMTLGIPLEMVKVKPCSTLTNANTQTTGGSTTSELCCQATLEACGILNSRIKPIRDKNPDLPWRQLIQSCYNTGVDLTGRSFVNNVADEIAPQYFTYGVTATEVELDVLTGQIQIPRVDILYDCGDSMNPKMDLGQVEGAFVMGLGYFLTEKIEFDLETGEPKTINTWTYKPPSSKDIPIDFRVELLRNAPNPSGILGSKAVGEPPLIMSSSVLFAIKRAVEDARKDMGIDDVLILDGPATIDSIYQACQVDPSKFTF